MTDAPEELTADLVGHKPATADASDLQSAGQPVSAILIQLPVPVRHDRGRPWTPETGQASRSINRRSKTVR